MTSEYGTDGPRRPAATANPVRISPSDTTFLWNECRRCFRRKAKYGIRAPMAFPPVFGMLDRQQRARFHERPASDLDASLPEGRADCRDLAVRSRPLLIRGAPAPVVIDGRLDALIRFGDGTAGVVDFKVTNPGGHTAERYWPQLHAYAWAIERPAAASPPIRVSALGLLCFTPDGIEDDPSSGDILQRMRTTWIPVRRRDGEFAHMLREMAIVARSPKPPPSGERCRTCEFLRRAAA